MNEIKNLSSTHKDALKNCLNNLYIYIYKFIYINCCKSNTIT
jgi:hypothetical protein